MDIYIYIYRYFYGSIFLIFFTDLLIFRYIHYTLKLGLTRLVEFVFTYSARRSAIYISIDLYIYIEIYFYIHNIDISIYMIYIYIYRI